MKLDYYQDPGHGWVKVPAKLLAELKIAHLISQYSYCKGPWIYLEEDCDLSHFMQAMKSAGRPVELVEHHTNNDSAIRHYDRYTAPRKDPHQAVEADYFRLELQPAAPQIDATMSLF